MNLWRRFLFLMALVALMGCETTPTHLFTYAAQGTVIQAERLVGLLLGKEVWPLPYSGVNLDQPLLSMNSRFTQLKIQLDKGRIGLTDDGDVAIREFEATNPELFLLVREENRDRAVFYFGMAVAVGHGSDTLQNWLPYVKAVFGAEWQKQAPPGWWFRNSLGEWKHKP